MFVWKKTNLFASVDSGAWTCLFQDAPHQNYARPETADTQSHTVCTRHTTQYLEGIQRVHMPAKYTIILSCTRLHVYIHASLVMYVRVEWQKWAREHCLIQASPGSSQIECLWHHTSSRRLLDFAWYNCYIFVHFSSTPLRSWTWLYRKKANKTTFPTIHCPYGNIPNFSHTSWIHFSAVCPFKPMGLSAHRRTDKSKNSMSASFTPFTWWTYWRSSYSCHLAVSKLLCSHVSNPRKIVVKLSIPQQIG